MAQQADTLPATQEPKPRIVQYHNRRFSIRLEPVFWHALERQAELSGMRLGKYVAGLAAGYRGANFSSHLRVMCMLSNERALAQAGLRASGGSLVDLVQTSFTPALVLSRFRTIIAGNRAFTDWLGTDRAPADGADLTSVLQVRTRRPLNDLWLDLVAGKMDRADLNVLHVEPGRVLAAPARIVALPAPDTAEFYAVLWISAIRRASPEPVLRRRPAQTGPEAA